MDTIDRDFVPPHCPNRQCSYFLQGKTNKWFRKAGYHSTHAHGLVQRFRCSACLKSFSRQTFDLHYFSKRRLDWAEIREIGRSCCSDRAKARQLKVSPTTIADKIHRLAKWSLDKHHHILSSYRFGGTYCADGFETFTHSQYHPGHLNILVESSSRMMFTWDYQTIRRKGRMTPDQKQKRDLWEQEWKPARGALGKSFARAVVEPLEKLAAPGAAVVLDTDEHPVYPRVLRSSEKLASLFKTGIYVHNQYSSELPRTFHSPLLGVNYMDRELRKDLANHVREGTRFSREANHMAERVSIFAVDHNLNKKFRIKARKSEATWHWKVAGLEESVVKSGTEDKFLGRPWRRDESLGFIKRIWDRDIPGPRSRAKARMAGFWRD